MADETMTRRCIGSKRFGIEPHDAPVDDFPKQPSQKGGLGRMCKTHWNGYTARLARDAKARKASQAIGPDATAPAVEVSPAAEGQAGSARKRSTTKAAGTEPVATE